MSLHCRNGINAEKPTHRGENCDDVSMCSSLSKVTNGLSETDKMWNVATQKAPASEKHTGFFFKKLFFKI